MKRNFVICKLFLVTLITSSLLAQAPVRWSGLKEVNRPIEPSSERLLAIVGATLIDGHGGPPVEDSVVLIRGSEIIAVGPHSTTSIPSGAKQFDAAGRYLLPGFFDSHFHFGQNIGPRLPAVLLAGGVTSFRDPGRPLEVYSFLHETARSMPRAFLTGNHLDQEPPEFPRNAIILSTPNEVRSTVNRFVDAGASGIKVYYRLPLNLIRTACEAADRRAVPVMAHLEVVRADDAIRAGLDGIEHVSSLGTSLATPEHARAYEEEVATAKANRIREWYRLWSPMDFAHNPRLQPLLDLMLAEQVYFSPTLRPYEIKTGDRNATPERVAGFEKMVEFVGIAHRAGVPMTVASHGRPPEAYAREMELLVQAGLSPMDVIVAATRNGARYFGAQDRLGSIEPGKLADLVLLPENPLENISAVRSVERVMLNGNWIAGE